MTIVLTNLFYLFHYHLGGTGDAMAIVEDFVIRVQILDKAVLVSFLTNALRKGIYSSLIVPSLAFIRASGLRDGKFNSKSGAGVPKAV